MSHAVCSLFLSSSYSLSLALSLSLFSIYMYIYISLPAYIYIFTQSCTHQVNMFKAVFIELFQYSSAGVEAADRALVVPTKPLREQLPDVWTARPRRDAAVMPP